MVSFPAKVGNKTMNLLSTLLFNIVLEVLANTMSRENEIKDIQSGKEEIKLSLLMDNMIIYAEKPKEFMKKNKTIPGTNK